jgi:hypothetical protein
MAGAVIGPPNPTGMVNDAEVPFGTLIFVLEGAPRKKSTILNFNVCVLVTGDSAGPVACNSKV